VKNNTPHHDRTTIVSRHKKLCPVHAYTPELSSQELEQCNSMEGVEAGIFLAWVVGFWLF
jgi:hypothetical protein